MDDDKFAEEFGRMTGLGPMLAYWYWFGGTTAEELSKEMGFNIEAYIDEIIGYKGDSDNVEEFYQHLYDQKYISWDGIRYMSGPIPLDKEFLCIRMGTRAVHVESHGLPFFDNQERFGSRVYQEIDRLDHTRVHATIYDKQDRQMLIIRTY